MAANGILYQMSGSIEVSLGGEAKMLTAEGAVHRWQKDCGANGRQWSAVNFSPLLASEERSLLATVPQTKTPQSQQTREGQFLHPTGR